MSIARVALLQQISKRLAELPIAILLGPRQCGKTTLARQLADQIAEVHFLDLERPSDRSRLREPLTTLEPLRGLVIIDEAQLAPELFPILRVLADRPGTPARFLLTGSASPELIRGSSESLAGRAGLVPMSGFTLEEVGQSRRRDLWLRGGFPRSFLASNDAESLRWREDFIQLFLERDLRNFGIQVPAATLRRFWTMLAHYHGQIWNGAEIGRSLGESHTTVRRHLDILAGAFMVRPLQPWFENVGKRVVKSPKVYIRDSGIVHALLGLTNFPALESHPKIGASWEGFVIEEILASTGDRHAYFWATHGGAELDLLLIRNGKRYGVEVKYADAPGLTRSMHVAMEDLRLEHLWIVYPGESEYSPTGRVTVLPAAKLAAITV